MKDNSKLVLFLVIGLVIGLIVGASFTSITGNATAEKRGFAKWFGSKAEIQEVSIDRKITQILEEEEEPQAIMSEFNDFVMQNIDEMSNRDLKQVVALQSVYIESLANNLMIVNEELSLSSELVINVESLISDMERMSDEEDEEIYTP